VRCIKLDATSQGRPVYEKLGFKDEWTLRRWEVELSSQVLPAPDSRIRVWAEAGAPQFDLIDSRAFGVSRRKMIIALARQSSSAVTYESQPGTPAGCGMLRQGARGSEFFSGAENPAPVAHHL